MRKINWKKENKVREGTEREIVKTERKRIKRKRERGRNTERIETDLKRRERDREWENLTERELKLRIRKRAKKERGKERKSIKTERKRVGSSWHWNALWLLIAFSFFYKKKEKQLRIVVQIKYSENKLQKKCYFISFRAKVTKNVDFKMWHLKLPKRKPVYYLMNIDGWRFCPHMFRVRLS